MNNSMEEFTSGWAYFYKRTEKNNKNIESLNDLSLVNQMAFTEMSSRNEDLIMAESKGHSLNRKIKIRRVPFIKEQFYCLIDKSLYYVYQIDTDLVKEVIYCYLESTRVIINE